MKLEVYKNPEFGSIRTALVNEQIYFVGKDVAESLGYSNTKDALSTHVDTEDKTILQRSENTTFAIPNRGLTIINEYFLSILIRIRRFRERVKNIYEYYSLLYIVCLHIVVAIYCRSVKIFMG